MIELAQILITGGAGFIGTNLTHRLLSSGHKVTVYDNLSRPGCAIRLDWLVEKHPEKMTFIKGDITNPEEVLSASAEKDVIFHLAGQVAVTDSVRNPLRDFRENAFGTLNVLESARKAKSQPAVILASSNKVYGKLNDLPVFETETRYCLPEGIEGISERQPLDPLSPYGCSKAAADQYALDYFRVYGLRTVVMRQSCIYGPWQFGSEDQGWLAWFILAALQHSPITVYGDGKQVRDILYVDDLLDVYERVLGRLEIAAGNAYNIGGGATNSISIWAEFGPVLERLVGRKIPVRFSEWRPGDQKTYLSDIGKAERELNWTPKTGVNEGLEYLFGWLTANQGLIEVA